jgi:hypothetical protein
LVAQYLFVSTKLFFGGFQPEGLALAKEMVLGQRPQNDKLPIKEVNYVVTFG